MGAAARWLSPPVVVANRRNDGPGRGGHPGRRVGRYPSKGLSAAAVAGAALPDGRASGAGEGLQCSRTTAPDDPARTLKRPGMA